MLRAFLLTAAVLLCALVPPADLMLAGSEDDIVHSRPKMLRTIDGDTSEQRIYLERCRQSSLHESCVFATDDDINQEPWSNECAVTTADMLPFWEARFENPAYVSRVQIFGLKNIVERGFDALTDFDLIVGDHVCIHYKSYSSFTNKTFACDSFGDHVRVQSSRPHSLLALCEVVVYGKYVKLDRTHKGDTPLPYRKCLMSGTGVDRCHLALDGDLEQGKPEKCAATEKERAPWFTVTLAVPSLIHRIVIYNRVDKPQDNLNSFEVLVNGQMCFKYDQDRTFSTEEFFCGRFGTRVQLRITKPGEKNPLILCEMQLFGFMTRFIPLGNRAYVGCFRDKRGDARDLQKIVAVDNTSEEKCERICRRHKKPYFGLQQGKQCWCSERYGRYGELPRAECWMQCDGNPREVCGAKLVNAVYKLN